VQHLSPQGRVKRFSYADLLIQRDDVDLERLGQGVGRRRRSTTDQGNTDAQRVAVAGLEKRLEKIKADIDGCVENMARSTSESE